MCSNDINLNHNDDDIVISGISGRFPNSKNILELSNNLYNKIDCCEDKKNQFVNRIREGKVHDLEKFDALFFGFNEKLANANDPQIRCLIEHAYEAILDAGIDPVNVKGSNIGVFITTTDLDSSKNALRNGQYDGYAIMGSQRGMTANQISYVLGLNGPSFNVDSACSSTLTALDCAMKMLKNGSCDAAIVGASNVCLDPMTTLSTFKLGILAADGICRPFDKNASGYTRSEAISVMLLQKSKDAKRCYATVIHSKLNSDGYKSSGITNPSSVMQQQLFDEFYREIKFDPSLVDYIEAHATGTNVGDPLECTSIFHTFCNNRKTSLLIGSVKSSIGHTECASGLCSIVKCILACETGKIAPNINYKEIKPEIKSLTEGKLKIVDEITNLPGPLIGVNSFGFGGTNGHVLLMKNTKLKKNQGIPNDSLPRLVLWSGRSEESCNEIFNEIVKRPLDAEFINLLQTSQEHSVPANLYRGYGIFTQQGEGNAICIEKGIECQTSTSPKLVWVYSGMGSQWPQMGKEFMEMEIFRNSINECNEILKDKGLDLIEILTSDDKTIFDNVLHSFVGITATQIGLTNILRELKIEPDFIIGHSVGELACAYADGCLSLEDIIMSAYYRGKACLDTQIPCGAMAAIGLGYNEISPLLPHDIDVACHNGHDSTTISGPAESVADFVKTLKNKDVFAREVKSSNIPFHSRYMSTAGSILLPILRDVIKSPKERSKKWLSTSVPEQNWYKKEYSFCSAEYQTNNLLSPVLFEETMKLLPENAVTIEIAPHGLMQAILRRDLPSAYHTSLCQRNKSDNIDFLMSSLGKIYQKGFDMSIANIYPSIEYPVSVGTPNISSLIKWDHSKDYFVAEFEKAEPVQSFTFDIKSEEHEYLKGHMIDGKILFPATGYLFIVWKAFASLNGKSYLNTPVEFSDVNFVQATHMKDEEIILTVTLQNSTGQFEVSSQSNSTLATGHIGVSPNLMNCNMNTTGDKNDVILMSKDFYKELKIRGYHYNGKFKSVLETTTDVSAAKIQWKEHFISLMDCMFQLSIICNDTRSLMIATGIEKLTIDPVLFLNSIKQNENLKYVDAELKKELNIIQTNGIVVHGLQSSSIARRKVANQPVLESYEFVPLISQNKCELHNSVRILIQLGLEQQKSNNKVNILEVSSDQHQPIISIVQNVLNDKPLIIPELTLISDDSNLSMPSGVNIEASNSLLNHDNCFFLIGAGFASNPKRLEDTSNILADPAFIISLENRHLDLSKMSLPRNYKLISRTHTDQMNLVMIQYQKKKNVQISSFLEITSYDNSFAWIEDAKSAIKKGKLYLVAQGDSLSGIIGLVNCLNREPETEAVCVFIDDKNAPKFDPELKFYKDQLEKDLKINVYRDGVWGSYRHLLLDPNDEAQPQTRHCYANTLYKSDLSSLTWFNGNLNITKSNTVYVKYASLNFKDVMIATGKLNVEMWYSRLVASNAIGYEYSGVSITGERLMGIRERMCLATHVKTEEYLTWNVPNHWTLEEAATVPLVYCTVYLAFFKEVNIKKNEKILIHAGSGGVGLAAIRVALYHGLEVFTTVSTQEKKDYLLNLFPTLKESHIGNSRDTSFYELVMSKTNGSGVKYVLNSLAGDKLLASIKCLERNGHFIEIGKQDMLSNTKIGMNMFLNGITFHVVIFDRFLMDETIENKQNLHQMITKGVDTGVIMPLKTHVFVASDIQQAFRFLGSGKHIGKVLIKIRNDDSSKESLPITIYPMVYFNKHLAYIIPGGLGGFGLELADWMVLRGCRKLVLSSSRGISSAYQKYRINLWRSYGVEVIISTAHITTFDGCLKLIQVGKKLGDIGGIFNLAVQLRDGIFENQDSTKFEDAASVKGKATLFFDKISRELCPQLEYFVAFSSVSSGLGHAEQTSYGTANSIMERIIEQRKASGYPAKAIQWGPIAEVGLIDVMVDGKNHLNIGGMMQQRIFSCVHVLDKLLTCPDVIVSSMVIAEKGSNTSSSTKADMITSIFKIIGIQREANSMNIKLSQLGMDSIASFEIKQTLENDFNLNLSIQDLYNITPQYLIDLSNKKSDIKLELMLDNARAKIFDLFVKNVKEESNKLILDLKTNKTSKTPVIILPGIGGVCGSLWRDIGSKLNFSASVVQYRQVPDYSNYNNTIQHLVKPIQQNILGTSKTFRIIAYSFGTVLAPQIANVLEELGYTGKVLLIDGSATYLGSLLKLIDSKNFNMDKLIGLIIFNLLSCRQSYEEFFKRETWSEILQFIIKNAQSSHYSDESLSEILNGFHYTLCKFDFQSYYFTNPKIKSDIFLVAAKDAILKSKDVDYGLEEMTSGAYSTKVIDGNHMTILDNAELISILNDKLFKDKNKISE
uniref:CSON007223 protein n=1 Tax=Culicoides sonorensis TaxID=179676 RepID=A0A336KMM1_CULSO